MTDHLCYVIGAYAFAFALLGLIALGSVLKCKKAEKA